MLNDLISLIDDFEIPHQVVYDGNGNTDGTVPVDNTEYYSDDTVTVLGNEGDLVKTGYSFVGWNTADNGSGEGYQEGDTFTLEGSNITLYAQWSDKDAESFPWPLFIPRYGEIVFQEKCGQSRMALVLGVFIQYHSSSNVGPIYRKACFLRY